MTLHVCSEDVGALWIHDTRGTCQVLQWVHSHRFLDAHLGARWADGDVRVELVLETGGRGVDLTGYLGGLIAVG